MKRRLLNLIAFVVLTGLIFQTAQQQANADVRLAKIFGDNMVLQRNQPLYFFGTADPSDIIHIDLKGKTKSTLTMGNGSWMLVMDPIDVGDPFEVTVRSQNNKIVLKNVVAGEVWICSGQSNMEWRVAGAANPAKEVAEAKFPLIRHVKVNNTISATPLEDTGNSGWKVCSPDTAANFTAVGYYFGRHLHKELDGVPIGLINTSWGGTIIEAWTSGASLKTHPDFADKVKQIESLSKNKDEMIRRQLAAKRWERDFQSAIEKHSDKWETKELDVAGWKTVKAPGHWGSFGLGDVDGVAWYRKNIEVPDSMAGKDAILSLAMVDDLDTTYVNGQKVGSENFWNKSRVYKVPGSLVKAGTMSIAVRVTDTGAGGGIHGDPKTMFLKSGAERIQLAGQWKLKLSTATAALGARPALGAFTGPNNPTALYNAMVDPIIPINFKGAIWYQGESNAGRAYQYRTLFPLLIKDWRMKWAGERRKFDATARPKEKFDDFPFYWVQLANFTAPSDKPSDSSWAELREAQSMTMELPNSGEAVIIDIGEANDIHPKNKQDVGKRLALWALAKNYEKDVVYSGPRFKSMSVEGGKASLTFDHIGGGLVAKGSDAGKLKHFAICGEDKKFVWADAVIDGDKVIVSSPDVKDPVAIRYAWAQNPEGCNLYNAAGLPASPFRTDSFKGVTQY